MIIFKMQVAADQKYTTPNQANLVTFDVHNDSPYNVGVSFGTDTGVDNADYFSTPHGVLTGIGPKSNAPSVGRSRWGGTIYIYTETPLGTGITQLSIAPAFQITMIGYPAGYQPTGTTSLARMTTVPNAVNTVGGTASSIVNDGNSAGTSVVEATAQGDGASSLTLSNLGVQTLGIDGIRSGQLTIEDIAGSGQHAIYSGGNATIPKTINANLIATIGTNDLAFKVTGALNRQVTSVGGVNKIQTDASGTILLDGIFNIAAVTGMIRTSNPTAQTLANNDTITLPSGMIKKVTAAGAVTNITLSTAGAVAGDMFLLINTAGTGNSVAIATNIRLGLTLAAGRATWLWFDGSVWYPAV